MRAEDVLAVLDRLQAAGLEPWLDGGWGVDALLGRETRPHEDLDLVLPRAEVPRAESALAPLGFAHDPSVEPGVPARVVLRDGAGRQVDLHPVLFDDAGDGWQELGGGEWGRYPAAGLRGEGTVRERRVRCLTAELQLRHRLGYEPGDMDRHDVRLLAALLGRDPPLPYA